MKKNLISARFVFGEALKAVMLLALNAVMRLIFHDGFVSMTLSLVLIPMWITLDLIALHGANRKHP